MQLIHFEIVQLCFFHMPWVPVFVSLSSPNVWFRIVAPMTVSLVGSPHLLSDHQDETVQWSKLTTAKQNMDSVDDWKSYQSLVCYIYSQQKSSVNNSWFVAMAWHKMKSESWIFGPLQPGKVNRITQPRTMASNRAVVPRSRLLPSLRAAGIDFKMIAGWTEKLLDFPVQCEENRHLQFFRETLGI